MHLQYIFAGFATLFLVGLQHSSNLAEAARIPSKKPLAIRVQQCREGCLEKFAIKESLCQKRPECSTNGGFPPYNYNSLPDALHLLCWDECAKPPPPKLNKSIRETWALHTVSMVQHDSLVLVDVAWAPLNTPNQCLVTWEVDGGGLMGNLLTETYNVQLSLWPDTKYRVQVTCKNKITESMSRSLPLNIDTSEAIKTNLLTTTTTAATATAIMSNRNDDYQSIRILTKTSDPDAPPPISEFVNNINQLDNNNDDDNDSLNTNTNFIFNWHLHGTSISNDNNNNNDDDTAIVNDVQMNRIEHLNQSDDLNILAIATISDIQKPLIFDIIAGTLLLTVAICLYIFILRSQRVPSDKAALIDDDINDACVKRSTIPTASSSSSANINDTTNHFGGGPSVSLNPAYYSRRVHVLTV